MDIRECLIHGKCRHRRESNVRWRCCKCRSDAVQRARRKIKLKCVEYKGGRCERCGYNKCISVLEFHHRDPDEKDFGIARSGHTRSFEKIKPELDKCEILCANCHREEHDRLEGWSESKVIKQCKHCDKVFETSSRGKQTYCSRKCLNYFRKHNKS